MKVDPRLPWNPDDYVPVRERVDAFRAVWPTGRIVTELQRCSKTRTIFRALVYRTTAELEPAATGWASEREGDGEINVSSNLENAETSAVGRALANLGFSPSRPRPVRPELPFPPAPAGDQPPPPPPATAQQERSSRQRAVLEAEADALLDVLLLLQTAERAGLPGGRVGELRAALTARTVAPSVRQRIERELRQWLQDHQRT